MAKKAKWESQNEVIVVQIDTDGDMTWPETVYNNGCEPASVQTLLMDRLWCQKLSRVKFPNGRGELIVAQ